MKKKDIKYFREMLSGRLEELLNQANDTVADLLNSTINEVDPVDQASVEADRNFKLRLRDRESRLIRKIKQSLERIEEGTFGICEVCGDDISVARLKARPVTTYCITCKTEMEALENQLA